MIGFYLYPYKEGSLAPSLKTVINRPNFVPLNDIQEEFALEAGKYVILCCTFESAQIGTFSVQVQAISNTFKFTKLDMV